MPSKLKAYYVYYTSRSKAKVKALSASGARKKAWDMLGGYRYGWTREKFLKEAKVVRV